MKINDNVVNPKWHNIACTCDHSSVLTEFPIKDCIHCKCELSENSIPKNDFTITELDENGNKTNKTISEITIVRDTKFQQCVGWCF